jgi:membrane protease YdiL (CAAX protease family)
MERTKAKKVVKMKSPMSDRLTLKDIFTNPEVGRLRAGWRLLVQLFLYLSLAVVAAFPAGVVYLFMPEWFDATLVVANAIPMVLSVIVARKLLDRRSVRSLGLKLSLQAALDVIVGIAISAAQLGLIMVIELSMGWLVVEGFGWQEEGLLRTFGGVIIWLGIFAMVGFYEEFFSRGYQLQNLEEGLNTFWAVLLSSVFFGLLHIANQNASWVSTVGIMMAGLFLAYAYLRTRSLWLAIGLHFGWNSILGPVLGFPVSGIGTARLLVNRVSGPTLWTGGDFGPEAGLVVLPAIGLGAVLIWLYTRRRVLSAEMNQICER